MNKKIKFRRTTMQSKKKVRAYEAFISVANWPSRKVIVAAPTAAALKTEWEQHWPGAVFDYKKAQRVKIVLVKP